MLSTMPALSNHKQAAPSKRAEAGRLWEALQLVHALAVEAGWALVPPHCTTTKVMGGASADGTMTVGGVREVWRRTAE